MTDPPSSNKEKDRPGWRRYFVAWLSCLGFLIMLAMRSEIGIAIIQMTKKRHIRKQMLDSAGNETVYKTETVQEIAWNHVDIGLVESSFFIGYALFSIPGGLLASRLAAPGQLLGAVVLISCTLNLLVPAFARLQPSGAAFVATVMVRTFQGAAESCLYPCVHAIWRYWAPAMELSRLATISFFGMALGPIIGLPLSGFLTDQVGWESNFYVYGVIGFAWAVVWLAFVPGQPASDKSMSEAELRYITASSSPQTAGLKIPLRSIATSGPVWAIVLANAGRNWTFQFSTIGLPAYYVQVFQLNLEAVGLHLMVPFVLMAALTPIGGILADRLRRDVLDTTGTRKLLNNIGFGPMAGCMLLIGFSQNPYLSTALLTVGFGFTGLGKSGYGVNHLDIAPAHAGFLVGLTNGIGTISGAVSLSLASRMTRTGTLEEWRSVFLVAAAVHAVTVLCYYGLASGETQPWADTNESVRLLETTGTAAASAATSGASAAGISMRNSSIGESDKGDKESVGDEARLAAGKEK